MPEFLHRGFILQGGGQSLDGFSGGSFSLFQGADGLLELLLLRRLICRRIQDLLARFHRRLVLSGYGGGGLSDLAGRFTGEGNQALAVVSVAQVVENVGLKSEVP